MTPDTELDAQALEAFAVVGNFARHLEILPEEAGLKYQSWADTLERLRR